MMPSEQIRRVHVFKVAILLLLSLGLVSGCGDHQESPRKELATLGKDFSPAIFMNCIRNEDQMAVRLFIEAGMDVNKPESSGFTPLMIAAWNGNVDAAKLLVEKGANPTATLADGRTAIRIAQDRQHPDVANLLATKLPENFFIGTWQQHTEISDITWEFRSDGTCAWHAKYSNNTEETFKGNYKVRPGSTARIVECAFNDDNGKPLNLLLMVAGDRLFQLNNESDMKTDDPGGWLNRK